MKIVFMGTPDFALQHLKALHAGRHEILAVFTQPDKPVGRKRVLTPPPVKHYAEAYGIPVYQPERLKGSNAAEIIKKLAPDIIVVVAYGKILPAEIINAAPYGCINVHASLLPKYRGAAPIQWAVINGEKETGVTVMKMDEGLDTGDIILTKKQEIYINETSEDLFFELSLLGSEALLEALDLIESGKAEYLKQPEGDFGYAKMITKELCPIDWSKPALEVHNLVRGLQDWPVALTKFNGKNLKIHKTILSETESNAAPGTVVENGKHLVVACGDGKCVEIIFVQPEGKNRMLASAYMLGHPIEIGTVLGE